VIPLPRFATGDLARLLSAADTARAAQLAGVEAPWLPVVLLRGRQADQGGDVPSVERIKALIYADFDDAELLTGAFRIRPGTDAATPARAAQVFVQARQATTAKAGGLQARLQQQADQHGLNVDVCVLAPEAFPGRPHLDFERKLDHWMPRLPKFPEP
jgi:hypothetical protein